MEQEEDLGIKGELGEDYISKGMPSIERRHGHSWTIKRNNGN